MGRDICKGRVQSEVHAGRPLKGTAKDAAESRKGNMRREWGGVHVGRPYGIRAEGKLGGVPGQRSSTSEAQFSGRQLSQV